MIFSDPGKVEMKYEGSIIRPPSEAGSLLLQVTTGCSHNRCTFCGSFTGKRFRIKSPEGIEEDILEAAAYGPTERIFLCDGDAPIIPQKRLGPILESINRHIKGVGAHRRLCQRQERPEKDACGTERIARSRTQDRLPWR